MILSMSFYSTDFLEPSLAYELPKVKLVLMSSSSYSDECLLISQYLEELGFDIEIKLLEWSQLLTELYVTHSYDLVCLRLGGGSSPDYRDVYTEDGSLNIFGLNSNIPYVQENEDLLNEAVNTSDFATRQLLFYDWQEHLMDTIVPMLPLYSPRSYGATWSNTVGYDFAWGLVDSLPYMYYDGLHEGQISLNEFNIADAQWAILNPLFSIDSSSNFINSLLSEPIVNINPDLIPIKTGIVSDWTKFNDYHWKFNIRNSIFWNPSYNIIGRSSGSPPLSSIPSSELMKGLKSDEYSDGSNQQLLAKDVVFTLLAHANSLTSRDSSYYDWISDIYVDPIDELAFHIHIDANPSTPENEVFVDFWSRLSCSVLPEFFLNSSSSEISYTSGNVKCVGLYEGIEDTAQWEAYADSAFGNGKYMLDYYVKHSITTLTKSPFWHGFGAIDGNNHDLDIETINVRIIPDMSAELSEFQLGKLDYTGLSSFPTERRLMEADPRFSVYSKISNSLKFLGFNLVKNFISSVNDSEFVSFTNREQYTHGAAIRKAMCHAINREEMNNLLYEGENIISHSVVNPYLSSYYYDDISKYSYDLTKAKQWLSSVFDFPPEYEVTVANHHKVGKEMIAKIRLAENQNYVSTTFVYSVNGGDLNYTMMTNETENIFTLNLGSNFSEFDIVQFYLIFTNEYGVIYESEVYLFVVGVKDTELLSSANLFISVSSIICLYTITRRKKKRKTRE